MRTTTATTTAAGAMTASSSSSLFRPIIGLLHSSPLKNNFTKPTSFSSSPPPFNNNNTFHAFADPSPPPLQDEDEIGDIEIERERQDVKQALQQMHKQCVLLTLPMTRDNLVRAFKTCHILLLGAHGVPGGGIVIESNVYQGEILLVDELRSMLLGLRGELLQCRFCFVSSCYSEQAGRVLVDCGVRHVVTIAGDNRISNLVSRSFFSSVLKSILCGEGVDVASAVEAGLQFVEAHPELNASRRARQREKFVYYHRPENGGVFDDDEVVRAGSVVEEQAEHSKLVGFSSSTIQQPGPVFGRQELIQDVLCALLGDTRLAVLKQTAPGMGSSLVVHYVASYLATRRVFDVIELVRAFPLASSRLLRAGTATPRRALLLLVDADTDVGEREFWQLLQQSPATRFASASLLVVSKSSSTSPPLITTTPFAVDPLKPKYVVAFLDYLVKGSSSHTSEPPATQEVNEAAGGGNPLHVMARAKTTRLSPSLPLPELVAMVQHDLPPVWRPHSTGAFSYSLTRRMMNLANNHTATAASAAAAATPSSSLPIRQLAGAELAFLESVRSRYASHEVFWAKWLKPTLQCLVNVERYWRTGVVWGFVSEADADAALLAAPRSSSTDEDGDDDVFVLRFSERNAGSLTLSHLRRPRRRRLDIAAAGVVEKVSLQVSPASVSARRADGSVMTFSSLSHALAAFSKLTHVLMLVLPASDAALLVHYERRLVHIKDALELFVDV